MVGGRVECDFGSATLWLVMWLFLWLCLASRQETEAWRSCADMQRPGEKSCHCELYWFEPRMELSTIWMKRAGWCGQLASLARRPTNPCTQNKHNLLLAMPDDNQTRLGAWMFLDVSGLFWMFCQPRTWPIRREAFLNWQLLRSHRFLTHKHQSIFKTSQDRERCQSVLRKLRRNLDKTLFKTKGDNLMELTQPLPWHSQLPNIVASASEAALCCLR